ncbi:MAG: HD domain-containing protein [Saprospiraceae bacterium]|nr:HD domain-containing protein [Saprospiraceae bacterium]
MVFNIHPEERKLFNTISEVAGQLGFPVYIVGGYVRDRLLARATKDIDIVCVGDGITLAESVANVLHPKPRVTVFKRFGTAMIRHNDTELEFVGARKESYTLDSRKPEVDSGTLEDDQNRRDFTINALAISLNPENFGEIIDPFNGLHHLTTKTIKTPLEPGKTFSDDPLRIMRAIRFATQLDFEIEERTLKALAKYKGRLKIISRERITTELEKIIASDRPSKGFNLLMDTGILEIIFPEFYALRGVEIRDGIGHKDNFYHTLEVLENVCKVSDNIWLRWAAILHDIAKPPTKRFEKGIGWTFHGHEALGAVMVPKIFKTMRLPLDHKMKYVQKLVRLHLRPIALTNEEITDSAVRRLIFEAGEDIDDLMMLCNADITSKNQNKVERYKDNYERLLAKIEEVEETDKLRNWQPPITGEDIMHIFNIPPGKEVGVLKTAIREAILDGAIGNNYEDAKAFLMEAADKMGLKPVQ